MTSKSPVEAIRAARNNLLQERRLVIEDLAKGAPPTKNDMQRLVEYQKAIDALDAALADEQAHGVT